MKPDPKRTYAIVVGVDRYEVSSTWNLHGPAADAVRFTRWLTNSGVPDTNIQVCISPLDESALTDLKVAHRDAKLETIRTILTQEVRTWDGDLLIVFWGGHGAHDNSERRILFCEDSKENDLHTLRCDEIQRHLKSEAGVRLAHQVLIFDACDSLFEHLGMPTALDSGELPHGRAADGIEQFLMFAAGRGQYAANRPVESTGEYSSALLGTLARSAWPPDFPDVATQVAEHFKANEKQTPVWEMRDWKGNVVSRNARILDLTRYELRRRLREVGGLLRDLGRPWRELLLLFKQTIRFAANPLQDRSIDAILEFLANHGLRPGVPADAEFFVRAARRYKNQELASWIIDKYQEHLPVIDAKITAEHQVPRRWLLFDVASVDSQPTVQRAFLLDPQQRENLTWTREEIQHYFSGADFVQELISAAVECIEDSCILNIEFAVPSELLFWAFQDWQYRLGGLQVPLNEDYHVMLRWRDRMETATLRRRWFQVHSSVTSRVAASGAARLGWLDESHDPSKISQGVKRGDCGDVISFSFVPAHQSLGETVLLQTLAAGAPYAVWQRKTPADWDQARENLQACLSCCAFDEIPGSFHGANAQSQPLTVLWDEPARNPFGQMTQMETS